MDTKKTDEILNADLFKELGLENLSPEEKKNVVDEAFKVIMQGLWVRVLEHLTPEEQADVEAKIEGVTDPVEFVSYLKTKVPNLDELLKEEIANYKSVLLAK